MFILNLIRKGVSDVSMFILYVCSLTFHSRIFFLYEDIEGRVNTIEFQLVITHEGIFEINK